MSKNTGMSKNIGAAKNTRMSRNHCFESFHMFAMNGPNKAPFSTKLIPFGIVFDGGSEFDGPEA